MVPAGARRPWRRWRWCWPSRLLGFSYLEALPAIHDRYYDGVGGRRPVAYWMWGNLAALAFSAGPLAFAGVAQLDAGPRCRATPAPAPCAWLSGAGVAMVLLADLSQMSRAEVERIWLPFVPWLLLSCALLPERVAPPRARGPGGAGAGRPAPAAHRLVSACASSRSDSSRTQARAAGSSACGSVVPSWVPSK